MELLTAKSLDEFREAIGEEPAFANEEYRGRRERAQAAMSEVGIDVLVLFDPQSICYFSGYTSVNLWDLSAVIIPATGSVRLVLWEFEIPRLEASGADVDLSTYPSHGDPVDAVAQALRGLEPSTFAVDTWTPSLPVAVWERLGDMVAGARHVDARPVLWRTRLIKTEPELEVLRRAAAVTDVGIRAAIEAVGPGVRDREIAAAAAAAMLEAGSGHFSIQPIVTVGPRAGVPHSEAADRKVRFGEGVFLEFGASVSRYTSPCMRTVVCGEPHPDMTELGELAARSTRAAADAIQPGALASSVEAAARKILDEDPTILFHGYFGYPVGVSFPPSWLENLDFYLGGGNDAVLETGMVFHVPISLRRRGTRGVGLSYTIAVGRDGPEILTGTPLALATV